MIEDNSTEQLLNRNQVKESTLSYASGYVLGWVALDSVSLGDKLIFNQTFLLAQRDIGFDMLPTDGILGLGFPDIAQLGSPVLETMLNQGVIDHQIFSVYLNDNAYNDFPSVFIMGDYDLSKYSIDSEFTFISLLNGEELSDKNFDRGFGYWSVSLQGVYIPGNILNNHSEHHSVAILDTGTSALIMHYEQAFTFFNILEKEYGCFTIQVTGILIPICQCRDINVFPDLTFQLDGKNFTINAVDYVQYY